MELDRIHAARHRGHRLDVVPHRTQRVAYAFGNGVLDLERIALGPNPGRLDRFLQAHAVIDQIDQRLQRAWKDPLSTGQAQRVHQLALTQRHHRRHRSGDALARQ